jgi:hypothetical protein
MAAAASPTLMRDSVLFDDIIAISFLFMPEADLFGY